MRKRISDKIVTNVLLMSRRRCCLCWGLKRIHNENFHGQIAHLDRVTKLQIATLRKSIDKGKPITMGLICVKGVTADSSKHHQVLATGYRYETKSKDLRIHIYDPNYPDKDDVYILLNLGMPNNFINISHSKGPWVISKYATGKWTEINSLDFSLKELAFADFTDNGKADVFRASGEKWYISEDGVDPWKEINTSGHKVKELAFAKFSSKKKADVFRTDKGPSAHGFFNIGYRKP
ncbi:MAG: hypothetical protein JXB26_20145 [Candidatus Aminicenantes bacterium]|nr:hypothetical protein [Candidatus Aminicenantes bacterium]